MKMEDEFDNYKDYIDYKNNLILMLDDIKVLKKPHSNSLEIVLTSFGLEVIEKGGWLKYQEDRKEKEKLNAEKENYDFLSKRWIYKNRLLPYFLSVAALTVSILTLYFNAQKQEKIETLKKEIEKIKTEIHTKKTKPNG
ncbi:hypothetical protein [Flavobacterium cheongpyeongense]|uniref:hypothetical protein n=1 Tax=Flavobacterium cheongpyeongense TaxID=2212651 RepID=UPI000F4E8469|nr:hypothetical protein [Flavobacterium cheongpyeongense]